MKEHQSTHLETNPAREMLDQEVGWVATDLEIVPLPNDQELLKGRFKNPELHHPHRPFRIVIHRGFHDPDTGFYLWQELKLQIRYALRHGTGDIDITVPRIMTAGAAINP
jgi:hypothetical protein